VRVIGLLGGMSWESPIGAPMWQSRESPESAIWSLPPANTTLDRSGRVFVGGLVDVEAADGLVDGLEDEGPVLGEQMAVDVLGCLDLAVAHLVRYLHVRGA